MFAVIMANPDPVSSAIFFLLFITILMFFLMIRIMFRIYKAIKAPKPTVSEDKKEVNKNDVIERIKNTKSANELMIIVQDVIELYGKENAIFLEKALTFEADLIKEDWEDIISAAESESELEKTAIQKAGFTPY